MSQFSSFASTYEVMAEFKGTLLINSPHKPIKATYILLLVTSVVVMHCLYQY